MTRPPHPLGYQAARQVTQTPGEPAATTRRRRLLQSATDLHVPPRGRIKRQDLMVEGGGWQKTLEAAGLSE
jgi:hypothetical protein